MVKAKDEDKVDEKAAAAVAPAKAEEEKAETFFDKLNASGLYFVRDHSTGLDYVGESPQNDPEASEASKLRSTVAPLSTVAPRTGMQIKIKGEESFSVGPDFGTDTKPEDWARVLKPSGAPLVK